VTASGMCKICRLVHRGIENRAGGWGTSGEEFRKYWWSLPLPSVNRAAGLLSACVAAFHRRSGLGSRPSTSIRLRRSSGGIVA
jgi:hypothetical protein